MAAEEPRCLVEVLGGAGAEDANGSKGGSGTLVVHLTHNYAVPFFWTEEPASGPARAGRPAGRPAGAGGDSKGAELEASPPPPPLLLLPLPMSLLYTHSLPPTVAPTHVPTVHSLPPSYCCPYPCPYCTLTPSLLLLPLPVSLLYTHSPARGASGLPPALPYPLS